jgi:hypothetical protein
MGDYIVSAGAWLGRVVQVCFNVDVLFNDGSGCRIAWGMSSCGVNVKSMAPFGCADKPAENTVD